MSHYAITKINIKNPNKQMLREAIDNVVKRLGGQIVDKIEDYYGATRKAKFIGVKTEEIYRGVDIYINEQGEVQVGGDFYGYNGAVEDLKNEIAMEYVANATMQHFRQRGYNMTKQYIDTQQQKQIIVEGIGY